MQQNYLTLLAEDRNFRVQNKGGGYLDNNGLFRSYATKQELSDLIHLMILNSIQMRISLCRTYVIQGIKSKRRQKENELGELRQIAEV